MHRTSLIAVLLILSTFAGPVGAAERPNFILFITDDISWDDLGCYGNAVVRTPHLDKMAAEGLRFTSAYLTTSSCSPSRSSIITCRYPHNTGACELHTSLPGDQYLFPKSLQDAGYYTLLSGKNHMGGAVSKAFTKMSRGKGPGKEGDWVQLLRERPKQQPFFLWLASSDAHRGWSINDQAPEYDPAAIKVPSYLFDGPATRQDLAAYYHEVSRTDYFVGQLRDELRRQGILENTYFIYMSDNGRPFPRCKTRLYDSGIKTPLIISCPGKIKPAVSAALVSAIDIGPTILQLAGVDRDPRMQGVGVEQLLSEPGAKVRDYVFAEHNWHVHQAHERMVRQGDWVYIRNAWPERQSLCVEATNAFPAGRELWEAEAQKKLKPAQRDIFLVPRAAEELYNVADDPDQLNNVATTSNNQEVLVRLRKALDRWTEETGDTVPENPTSDRQDAFAKRYRDHRRGSMPGAEKNATSINHSGPVLQPVD